MTLVDALSLPTDDRVKAVLHGLRGHIDAALSYGTDADIAVWRDHFLAGARASLASHPFEDERLADRPAPPPARIGRWIVGVALLILALGVRTTVVCFRGESGCDGGLCGLCVLPALGGAVCCAGLLLFTVVIKTVTSRRVQGSVASALKPAWPTADKRWASVERLFGGVPLAQVAQDEGVSPASVRAWWTVALDGGTTEVRKRTGPSAVTRPQ